MKKGRVILQVIFTRLFILFPFFYSLENAGKTRDSTTVFHTKYADKFIVSLYQSERRFSLGIKGINGLEDSLIPIQYRSDARRASGIAVDWDKISFSLDYQVDIPDTSRLRRFGDSKYFNFSFGLSSGHWLLETSFRKFTGFYDFNSPAYLDTFKTETSAFYQNPDLTLSSHKFKFLWFSNRDRFSPKAPYNGIYRQLKTSGAWALVSNISFSRMSSAGTLIPAPLRISYEDGRRIDGFNALHYNVGGGASFTLVLFKRVFVNFSLWGGPDMQIISVSDVNGIGSFRPALSYFAETRSSIGVNAKNFFILLTSFNDASYFLMSNKEISPSFFSAAFEIGYRFPTLRGKWIDLLKENKWYRKL